MQSTLLLTGIGLEARLFQHILEKHPGIAWIEIHSESFFNEGGHEIEQLEQLKKLYPISLHGDGLSLGSSDELNWQHLKQLKDLIARVDACLVSDHLAWSSLNGQYFHDQFPLIYNETSLNHIAFKIQQVQDYLQRQILIENIPHYFRIEDSSITEPDFIKQLVDKTGCGVILDINALYVSADNLDISTSDYLTRLPGQAIQEIHVSGFDFTTLNGDEILIASKNRPILPAIWELYKTAIATLGHKPCIVEWNDNLPSLDTLCLEAFRAETMMRESNAATKLTG